MHRPLEQAIRRLRAPLRILLVEDDEAFRSYVRTALSAAADDTVELAGVGDLADAYDGDLAASAHAESTMIADALRPCANQTR